MTVVGVQTSRLTDLPPDRREMIGEYGHDNADIDPGPRGAVG